MLTSGLGPITGSLPHVAYTVAKTKDEIEFQFHFLLTRGRALGYSLPAKNMKLNFMFIL
jgi:hypothetical protein